MILSGKVREILRRNRDNKPFIGGLRIYQGGMVDMQELDLDSSFAGYYVKSESSESLYEVELHNFHDPENFISKCNCAYDIEPICKHAYAALKELSQELEFQELNQQVKSIISGSSGKTKIPNYTPKKEDFSQALPLFKLQTIASMGRSSIWTLQHMAHDIQDFNHKGNLVSGKVEDEIRLHSPKITFEENRYLKCDCTCQDISKSICRHGYVLMYAMASKYRCHNDVLFPLRDHEDQIGKAIGEYGFTLKDNWRDNFEVEYEYPNVLVEPKDPGLSKIAKFSQWKNEISHFVQPIREINTLDFRTSRPDFGILWNYSYNDTTHVYLNLLTGKRKKNGSLGAPLRIHSEQDQNPEELSKGQIQVIDILRRARIANYLFSYNRWGDNGSEELHIDDQEDHYQRISEVYDLLLEEEHYFCSEPLEKNTVPASKMLRIFPQEKRVKLHFEFRKEAKYYHLKPLVEIDESVLPLNALEAIDYGVFRFETNFYLLEKQSAKVATFFSDKTAYKIRHKDLPEFSEQFLIPLMEQFKVNLIETNLDIEEKGGFFKKKLYLKEVEEYLLFIPTIIYQVGDGIEREVHFDGGTSISFKDTKSKQIYSVQRDKEFESKIWDELSSLHPRFQYSLEHYFSLPISQVMSKNWFMDAFGKFKEMEFEIMGLKGLKKLTYNPYRPTIRLQASSDTDWFDVDVEVNFGDQRVKLSEIRKAVLNNQQYVKLGDGSIGMLPEEWLKKYSTLFKLGKISKGKVKLSQFQVNAVDGLYEEMENREIFLEILEKRQRLQDFTKIKKVDVPAELTADLRNYQKEGYNWLNFLDEFQWGGCLADDMGLGKTVQMLAFLMHVSQQNKGATHLVIVPRSLVFNWMSEVEKFCPGYKALRHTGADRSKDGVGFSDYDLIITTYGLARSDADFFKNIDFHYIVLDESQAIKNPTTQTAKAVKTLKAKNRMIMTGTPIENNTFDLYSQMDFLNPGMLGSLEGFRREYANPIDKNKDEEVAEQLRKLVYPFILSRKKQEVAKELPAKTETVLYCEMPPAQRKVYDHFKDKYRNLLIEKIETEGYQKAGMYILQGLIKLRQICNSASLLAEEEGLFSEESAKMEILFEMLEEIFAEGHKVLIFSFFKGMLEMIGAELQKRGVDYVKLTGESQNREGLVDTFKNDENKQAFLISLKAGGFGLNLAEANYVFLVDPWWNPAVEQQAIDRTHRIGQTRNVFAYKLICKDTIEEKILKLQEKKKALAKDIIHVESGFLKKLNPEDVTDLFS